MDELEKKAKEIQDGLELAKKADKEVTEVKSIVESVKTDVEGVKLGIEGVKGDIDKMQSSIEDIAKEVKNSKVIEVEKKNLKQKIAAILQSDEYKAQVAELKTKSGNARTKTFETKDDPTSVLTSGLTGDVTRTMAGEIFTQGYEPNKFLANITPVLVPQNKNKAMWFDGAYFDNVGYVTELTALSTGDGATLEEKSRELAKVGAFLPYSEEVADDMDYFLNWAVNEGIESVLGKIDDLIYSGVGADGGAYTKNIYGIKTQGTTAFNATTAGLALAVSNATLADLVRAMQTQIRIQTNGKYSGNLLFAHPSLVTQMYLLKNTQADYINIMPNGALMIWGIPVAETTKVGATELVLVDTKTWKLHQKGSLELETERIASTDSYKLHLRWRGQVVVPTNAKLGNVYVANYVTSLAALNAVTPTTLAPTTTVAPTTVAPTTTTGG